MSYFHKFVEFSKAMFTILPKIVCPCSNKSRFAEKNRLSENTERNANLPNCKTCQMFSTNRTPTQDLGDTCFITTSLG